MKPTKPMTAMKAVAALGLALGMMVAGTTTGHTQITIPTVLVGDPGNPSDPSTGGLYGSVGYTYAIGKYEVTLSQYAAFLNAVAATDTYSLYNRRMALNLNIAGIARSGSSGSYTYSVTGPFGPIIPPGASSPGNRPVTYVSWFDAARFANWMANGQPVGAQGNATTENGAYSLFGAMSGISFTKNAINPNTGTTTTWWIPSEDEWYKAAYYDPGVSGPSDDYWLYPTRSDSAPGNNIGAGTNQANYYAGDYAVTQSPGHSRGQNYLTDGGAFSSSGSFYGTFDQGGNVSEWNDAVISSSRGFRGGSWSGTVSHLRSSFRHDLDPRLEDHGVGFRVATIPEPSTAVLMLLGGGAWLLLRRRKATL